MVLLDHLIKLKSLSKAAARDYAAQLYRDNVRFRQYVNMTYQNKSRWTARQLPKSTHDDTIPHGMDYSMLEMITLKVELGLYNLNRSEDVSLKVLSEVCDSISKIEWDFIKRMANAKLPYITHDQWEELYNAV